MCLKLSIVFIIHNLLTTEGREMNTKKFWSHNDRVQNRYWNRQLDIRWPIVFFWQRPSPKTTFILFQNIRFIYSNSNYMYIYMKIKIIIVVVPHKEVWDERSNLKTWSSPSTDIIMIVNTLTLANAWMLKHWPTQKPSSYSRLHTHIHTHTDTNVYSHDTTVLIIVHAHLPFIPGVHKLDLSSNIFTAGKLTYSIYALSFVDFPQIP